MSKKSKKNKKSPRFPKENWQIPNTAVRASSGIGVDSILQDARNYPLYGCWIMENWREMGITPVVVARKQADDRIMFGVYMVDYYCLGIKDAFTRTGYPPTRFERDLPHFCSNAPVSCPVDFAHELIYGALEYAQKLGFDPHPDFYRQKADQILDPPDAHPRKNRVTFGIDGKPYYVSGPYETPMKIKSIINTLTRTVGPGNFSTMIEAGDFPGDLRLLE